MRRRDLIAAAAGALAATALAGGVAWAAIPAGDGTIQACYGKVGGVLRVIDAAKGQKCLPNAEVAISWNQLGQQGPQGMQGPSGQPGSDGDDGASPTVLPLATGDTNCPAGGAAITDAGGSTAYVCSGQNGEDGAEGEPFSGTFTSPNGEYSISVTDAGVTLSRGPGLRLTLAGDKVFIQGNHLELKSALDFELTGQNGTIDANSILTLTGSTQVRVNGGSTCAQAARVGDVVNVNTAPNPGSILTGSSRVCMG